MTIAEKIRGSIEKALEKLDIDGVEFTVEYPTDTSHGDYSTNAAMVVGKKINQNPQELAQRMLELMLELNQPFIERMEVAGPGFINFTLSKEFFGKSLEEILTNKEFGKNDILAGEKVMVEYTDPNPFKEFHIGHLMSNAIGESISRLLEFSGAKVKRANYQGDVGLHVAKAIWGKMKNVGASWGDAYAYGSKEYEDHKEEINDLNQIIYDQTDETVNKLYEEGKSTTLEEFEKMYDLLGTNFDEYFFESEVAPLGKELVEKNIGDVFSKSDGAIVLIKERSGLHTRVFLNSQGLPTYEAKELALAGIKNDRYKYDRSIVITGNEINEYFKVVHKAMEYVYPELAMKTQHLSHGMLRLPSGKMSSRTGDVVTALSLIDKACNKVMEKMEKKDSRIADQVAIGAIKYSILKQSLGKDVIFDIKKSLSLEGDSGPYLQYTYVRAKSVLEKAKETGIKPSTKYQIPSTVSVERLLHRFPNVVEDAALEYAPHKVLHFLTSVASSFNSFYADEKIVDPEDKNSGYKLAITESVATILKSGLYLLGIEVPDRM